jgi:hypothetical protein
VRPTAKRFASHFNFWTRKRLRQYIAITRV